MSRITGTRDIKYEKVLLKAIYLAPGPKKANCSLTRQSIHHISQPS